MISKKKMYEKHVKKLAALPLLLVIFLLTASRPMPAQPPGNWNKIIRGQEYRAPLVLDEGDDNTLIVGAVFHDFSGDAITLGNVSNVYIKNCEIYAIDGSGIVFRSTKKTDRVTIDGCVIHDTTHNGIIAKQNISEGGIHTQLVIKNNRFYNNGTDELDHGLYIQASDTKIENNDISNSTGNGISIRSSGVVSGNKITNTQKSCIRYFSDNIRGPSNTLLIENNVCILSLPGSESPALSLLLEDNTPPDWIVGNFIIRFNTIAVFTGRRAGIAVESPELRSQNIQVYGNIVINTEDSEGTIQNENIDYFSSNYISTAFQGFENVKHPPYDLHLTPWSPAIDFANREKKFPVYDADGHSRSASHLDAGAYQLTRNTRTYAMRTLSYTTEVLILGGILILAVKGIQKYRQRKTPQGEQPEEPEPDHPPQ